MSALLEVNALTKKFGGITAVNNCSFEVQEGSITALIGPNGSGKTTAFNIITGYLKADSGSITFQGKQISEPNPASLYRSGLSRTFQQARIFPEITVLENLIVASGYSWRGLFGARTTKADRVRAGEMLEEFKLSALADFYASELSYGQRKLLEFASVLMSAPKLVLLDEPTAGVNPVMIETMERHIRARHAAGVTFLIVEHDMQLVMRLCDPVIVLDRGAMIARGTPPEVQANPQVLDAYLGS
ncbi:MAG: ABC transporter ATP-binding protein [Actinomycetes bacterium]|jgi:ABC-type branched-subunit amino acid transport system ATPase component